MVGISEREASEIIAIVKSSAASWMNFAKEAGVGASSAKLIDKSIQKLIGH